MGTITGLTAAAMTAIRNAVIEGASIVGSDLILTKHDGTTFNAGNARGASFRMTNADLANISGIVDSVVGDLFVNSDVANHTILGVANVPPGGVVKATSATTGTLQSGSLRGPASITPLITTAAALAALTPANGDEVDFQTAAMKTDNVMWRLKYDSSIAGSFKWIFKGGGPIHREVAAPAAPAVNGAYTDIDANLSFALPLQGTYDVSIGAYLSHTGNNQGANVVPVATGLAANLANAASTVQPAASAASGASAATSRRFSGLSGTLKAQYFVGVAAGATIQRVFLEARPVLVG